ncbi:histone H1-like isoform X2 [Episyrphus balteatus]|uniref:histone H1-like isoform X2 n=1 Tax=Episyrphus balteatus TaxID=286459 RepID=UPI0024850655|nr:histone H1-like isoform X2 [Episyrphus balteatus]
MDKFIPASSTPKKSRKYKHLNHPNTQTMVDEAFKVIMLNSNKCSYRAIKHFILTNYIVNMRYMLNRIKRESVANGKLIQMTGHGLNGSFRMSAAALRNANKMTKKSKKRTNKKPQKITFRIGHRRTSITRFSIKNDHRHLVKSPNLNLEKILVLRRSPKPRLAKIGKQYSLTKRQEKEDENNNNGPSTSAEATRLLSLRVTRQENSHMF